MNGRSVRCAIVQEDLERIVACSIPWERLFGKTVLVTGASGFLPAYMVETLLFLNETRGAGIRVIALVRNHDRAMRRFSAYGNRADLAILVQNVCEAYSGDRPVHVVIHAASQASPKYYGLDPVGTFETNVFGTRRMLELARDEGCESFLFFSSGEVYGAMDERSIPIVENQYGCLDPMDVRSCYGEGKRAGETLCTCWYSQSGIPIKVVRPFHTYGPGMRLDDGRVFADFVADVVLRRPIALKSDGSAKRAFCYLADATAGFFVALLLGRNGEAYNVGSSQECSILELAQTLYALFPERVPGIVREPRQADTSYLQSPIPRNCPDISKMRALGWEPWTTVREGFFRTVQSYE